jgi:hypothetical protein
MISPTAISLADGTRVHLCAVGVDRVVFPNPNFPNGTSFYGSPSKTRRGLIFALLGQLTRTWPGCLTQRYGWGMGPWYGSPVSRWCFFCALWLSDFSSMSRQSLAVVWWVASFNNDRPFHSHMTGGGMAYLVVEMLPSFSFHPSNQTFTLLLKISMAGVPSSAA